MRVVGVRFSKDILPHYACAMDHYLLTSSKYEHGYETREEDGGLVGVGEGNKECFYILLFRFPFFLPHFVGHRYILDIFANYQAL